MYVCIFGKCNCRLNLLSNARASKKRKAKFALKYWQWRRKLLVIETKVVIG